MHFVNSAIHLFKIPTKYFKGNFILSKIENPLIQLSTNMSIVFKPRSFVLMNLNDFTVFGNNDLLGLLSVGLITPQLGIN